MQPKFMADEMLAKLVRFMRVFGINVKYVEGKSDDEILSLLKRSNCTFLTSDEELVRRCRKRSIPALYLPQIATEKQITLVLSHFHLQLPAFPENTLCPKCGGKLERAKRTELKEKIYPAVLKYRRFFWKCAKCSHIYWSGTHYARLARAYRKIKRMMEG